ncbi:hypothetical protein K0G55_14075 [Bacteroides fragilis]|nr:hypothetical protein [Bacteroides fragilis]MCE9303765.1 hypothetical protein [Bacteroides fragilis]
MGKIIGNDNDFPTIKQVNDVLVGNSNTLDISSYVTELFNLEDTKNSINNNILTNSKIIELINKIINTKIFFIYGKGLLQDNEIEFMTSCNFCKTNYLEYYNYIISFKICAPTEYGFVYNFVLFKMLNSYFYYKFFAEELSFL